MPATARQRMLLDAITEHWRSHGRAPCHKELTVALGTDGADVHRMVRRLEVQRLVRVVREAGRRPEIRPRDPVEEIPTGELMRSLAMRGLVPEARSSDLTTVTTTELLRELGTRGIVVTIANPGASRQS